MTAHDAAHATLTDDDIETIRKGGVPGEFRAQGDADSTDTGDADAADADDGDATDTVDGDSQDTDAADR